MHLTTMLKVHEFGSMFSLEWLSYLTVVFTRSVWSDEYPATFTNFHEKYTLRRKLNLSAKILHYTTQWIPNTFDHEDSKIMISLQGPPNILYKGSNVFAMINTYCARKKMLKMYY